MFEDAAGKRCIKMAPPVAPKRSPDHDFDAEMPTRGKKVKSVLYKYNKKVLEKFLLLRTFPNQTIIYLLIH